MLSIHKFIPQTLLARFVLIIIVPTLIGQILAVFLFYDRHWYNVSYYTSNIIANEIISLLEKDDNNLLEKNTIATNYLNLSYQFYPKLTLPSTQPRISEELEIFKNIINVKINKNNIVKLNDSGRIELLLQLTDGLIQITFPAKLLMNPTAYIFVLWLIFLTILLLSVSLIFSKNQIKSILILADAADQFGQGITKLQTFKPSGAKEIRKAGIAFLKMKERIEKQISKRTRMLAMISHDLCTPLTRMKLQLELMNKSEETEGLKEDIVIMQQMIKSYLDFARGENGEEAKIIELSSWMLNVTNKWSANIRPPSKLAYAEEFEGDEERRTAAYSNVREDSSTAPTYKLPAKVEFRRRSIELITIGQPVYTQIKPSNFERAISNVINNAIKYSTKIKITICSTSTNVIIKIEDNGIGIKDEEKLLVFKAFYRSDKSRSLNNSGNVGLGLAITKEIIIDHSGTISLQDSKALGGLLVEISLPIIQK